MKTIKSYKDYIAYYDGIENDIPEAFFMNNRFSNHPQDYSKEWYD